MPHTRFMIISSAAHVCVIMALGLPWNLFSHPGEPIKGKKGAVKLVAPPLAKPVEHAPHPAANPVPPPDEVTGDPGGEDQMRESELTAAAEKLVAPQTAPEDQDGLEIIASDDGFEGVFAVARRYGAALLTGEDVDYASGSLLVTINSPERWPALAGRFLQGARVGYDFPASFEALVAQRGRELLKRHGETGELAGVTIRWAPDSADGFVVIRATPRQKSTNATVQNPEERIQ